MANISGKLGFIQINSTLVPFSKWTFELDNETVPVTNFFSGGFREIVTGITQGTIKASGPHNTGFMPIRVDAKVAFTLGIGPGMFTNQIAAVIRNVVLDEDVEGTPMLNITAETNGIFSTVLPGQ